MKQLWNSSEKNLYQYQFDHRKSHKKRPKIEPGCPRWEAGLQPLNHDTALQYQLITTPKSVQWLTIALNVAVGIRIHSWKYAAYGGQAQWMLQSGNVFTSHRPLMLRFSITTWFPLLHRPSHHSPYFLAANWQWPWFKPRIAFPGIEIFFFPPHSSFRQNPRKQANDNFVVIVSPFHHISQLICHFSIKTVGLQPSCLTQCC